jgi:hypothetical protein
MLTIVVVFLFGKTGQRLKAAMVGATAAGAMSLFNSNAQGMWLMRVSFLGIRKETHMCVVPVLRWLI